MVSGLKEVSHKTDLKVQKIIEARQTHRGEIQTSILKAEHI